MKLTSHKKQIIYDSIYTKVSKLVKVIETENIMVVTKDLGGRGKLLFNGYKISDLQEEKVLGDLFHNKVNIFNATELYT